MVDEFFELLEGTEDVETFEILEGGFEETTELGGGIVTGLHLGEVVITDHAVDEASSELGDGQDVERIVSDLFARDNSVSGNRADSLSESISGINTSIEVFTRSPVSLLVGDISLDGIAVQEPVLGNGLG